MKRAFLVEIRQIVRKATHVGAKVDDRVSCWKFHIIVSAVIRSVKVWSRISSAHSHSRSVCLWRKKGYEPRTLWTARENFGLIAVRKIDTATTQWSQPQTNARAMFSARLIQAENSSIMAST